MMCGRVKDVLRLLFDDSQGGLLSMDLSVMDTLLAKHPKTIVFDQLNSICICQAVLRISGAAGPDAAAWRRMCTSFQRDLCDALFTVARRPSTTVVDSAGLSAFVSCCLIALDKRPGVRFIGLGETVCHAIAKAVFLVYYSFVLASCWDVRWLLILYRHCLAPRTWRLLFW